MAIGGVGSFTGTVVLTILTTGAGVSIALGVGIATGFGSRNTATVGLVTFGSGARIGLATEAIGLVDGVSTESTATRSISVISRSSIFP